MGVEIFEARADLPVVEEFKNRMRQQRKNSQRMNAKVEADIEAMDKNKESF